MRGWRPTVTAQSTPPNFPARGSVNGDEIVQIVDGAVIFHIMTDDGPQSYPLKAGMVVIVPQGVWHRFEAPAPENSSEVAIKRPRHNARAPLA